MSEDINNLKRQHNQLKYDFEINAYENILERNRTRAMIRTNNDTLSNLQTVTENLQTSTNRNISDLDDYLTGKLKNVESGSKEYQGFTNNTLDKLTTELDSLRNGSFLLSADFAPYKDSKKEEVSLWVYSVIGFSSQLNDGGEGAIQVIGPPDLYPYYGRSGNAWAQGNNFFTANQYITVKFSERLHIDSVNIYETFNAGGVREIKSLNSSGHWETIWSTTQPEQITSSRIFSPTLKKMDYPTDTIDIIVDCSIARNFVQIDAVEIVGKRPNKSMDFEEEHEEFQRWSEVSMWASTVKGFSSQFSADKKVNTNGLINSFNLIRGNSNLKFCEIP